jgi:DNA integrity scanning protein DisA with diadenylate cyclase activity
MPEKVAITLINKYGSVWNVIHTEDAELLEIDGVGRGTIRNLKEGLGR